MKKHISFGEIQQFRNIVKNINFLSHYIGKDENEEPIFDSSLRCPIVEVTGSEKIHGSCGCFCFNEVDGFWCQSRKNIITSKQDNAGCAFFIESKKEVWMSLILKLSKSYNINLKEYTISIFFEWSGGSIQAKSACTGLDKRAIIFQHFKISSIQSSGEESSIWFETKADDNWISSNENNIFNVMNFNIWKFDIDFESPSLFYHKMIKIVEEEIEPNSPVGTAMGKDGNVGEGIVFTFMYNGVLHRFKVKGKKYSDSKVKKLTLVDEEKERNKIEFANYACTPCRLEQAWQNTFGINEEKIKPDIKFTGDFIRCVVKDVNKEELDIMIEKNIEPKSINSLISKIARRWFVSELDKYYGI